MKTQPTPKCPNRRLAKLRKQGKEQNEACLKLLSDIAKAREERLKAKLLKAINDRKNVAKV